MELSLPGYKIPPKQMQIEARLERERRKACHGTWYACSNDCSSKEV